QPRRPILRLAASGPGRRRVRLRRRVRGGVPARTSAGARRPAGGAGPAAHGRRRGRPRGGQCAPTPRRVCSPAPGRWCGSRGVVVDRGGVVGQGGGRCTMLRGEYEPKIDEKNRLTLPARFRKELAGGLVVTRGLDRCLVAFPRESWQENVRGRLAVLDPLHEETPKMRRFSFANPAQAEPAR